jgi:hypothetical protein
MIPSVHFIDSEGLHQSFLALLRHSAMSGTGDKTLVTIALDEKSPILSGLIRA